MVTKPNAVERLKEAGLEDHAKQLEQWRNARNENGGWDGWFRGNSDKRAVAIVWPNEDNSHSTNR